MSRRSSTWFSHQVKNWLQARAYASRVFRFRILAAKNSRNFVAAFSPALARIAGTVWAWRRANAFILASKSAELGRTDRVQERSFPCPLSMAVVAAVRSALFAPGETNVFCGASNGQFCFKGEIILPGLDSTAAYPPRGSRRTRFNRRKNNLTRQDLWIASRS